VRSRFGTSEKSWQKLAVRGDSAVIPGISGWFPEITIGIRRGPSKSCCDGLLHSLTAFGIALPVVGE